MRKKNGERMEKSVENAIIIHYIKDILQDIKVLITLLYDIYYLILRSSSTLCP